MSQEHTTSSLAPDSPNGQVLPSLSSSSEGTSEESSSSSSSTSVKDGALKETEVLKAGKGPRRKPRSEASVLHDKEKGVCSCKHCGWIYPNPRPSAKLRREHRKHCSQFQAWLQLDPAEQTQEQVEGMEPESADDTPDEQSPRKGDEVPTDDNDQPTNVDNVFIAGEISTGKRKELEQEEEGEEEQTLEAAVSSLHDPEEKLQTSFSPGGSSSSSTLHDHKLETSSPTFEQSTVAIEAGSSSPLRELEERKLAMEAGSSSPPQEVEERKLTTETEGSPSLDPSSSSQFDLEKILKEQTSHHLLCPNCGSCITRRVILKKRKRTGSGALTPQQQQEKLPKLEEPRREERAHVEAERGVEAGGDEAEAWGCLACFSIFFHKVREQLQEPLERAQNFSCLPYLLPDFHWDGEGYTASQELPERERSSCLPIEFPWSRDSDQRTTQPAEEHEPREVEIVIDLTKPHQPIVLPDVDWRVHEQRDAGAGAAARDESSDSSCIPLKFPSFQTREAVDGEVQESRNHLDCLPVLLPKYWGLEEEGELQSGTERTTAGFNCLPGLLPAYSWGTSSTAAQQKSPDVQVTRDIPQLTSTETTKVDETVMEGGDAKVAKDVSEPISAETTEEAPSEQSQIVTQETPSKVEGARQEEATAREPPTDDQTSVCLPLSLPNWTSHTGDEREPAAGLNCLGTVLPPFSWDGDGTTRAPAAEDDNICLPITFPKSYWRWNEAASLEEEDKTYVTKETRIHAWIKTITNRVTVKSTGEKREDKPTQATRFLDMTVTEQTEGGEKQTETLVKTPSTGWALLDALDKDTEPKLTSKLETAVEKSGELEEADEEEVKLIDNRKRRPQLKPQTEIEEVQPVTVKLDRTTGVQDVLSEFQNLQSVDDLKQPLLTSQEELDVEDILSKIAAEHEPPSPASTPVTATVSVKSSDSLIQVTGDDAKQAVETALALAEVIPDPGVEEPVYFEYVKSIVYGGLDVTLTSLAVVSSGAGSGTKTLNVLAISLANLVAGLITLLHSIGSMYQSDRASFEQYVGKSLWINGTLSVISFLIFGCIAPLTYGLSFRSADDRDYKFAVTAMASLACIGLMGLGKAYVHKKSYGTTIVNLVLTGFVASVTGYFVGDYVKRWLKKIGYDDEPPVAPAPPTLPPPLPGFLERPGLELGRRGMERSL